MKGIRFVLSEGRTRKAQVIELDEKESTSLKHAIEVLRRAIKHEELFDQLMQSYIDVKTTMFEMSIRGLADSRLDDYVQNHETRSKLNRLFFNSLNFSKLYLDKHVFSEEKGSYVKKITSSLELHNRIVEHRKEIQDTSSGYNLGCSLRNYVQHSALPVTNFVTGVSWRDTPEATFHIPLSKEMLKQGRVSSKDLASYGDSIDLHSVMDEYIYAISNMHMKSRELTSAHIEEAYKLLEDRRKGVHKEYGKVEYGINVIDLKSEKPLFSLHLDWFKVHDHLREKNSAPVNFSRYTYRVHSKP
ncbi:hypothetical protein QNE27_001372 [Vibrio alginolyticus]|uniref:hypothetical protein n=1 Tax=Vibrio alginolyticus TaxID=663 RepID=UPI00280E161C|nr:hypothetical protein [Vibrio alginolyticus]